MKGKSFSIPFTGKSPMAPKSHAAQGPAVPQGYAKEQAHMQRVSIRISHIRPRKAGRT